MANSSSPLATIIADRGTINMVGRDQTIYNIHYPQASDHQPQSPQQINDAPMDLLSVHFTGRESELKFLKEALCENKGDLPTRCAIYGMPGIGKSQLLLRYIKISSDQHLYTHIFWISATSIEKLNQGFSQLLELVGHPDRTRQEQSAKLTSARLWLENSRGDGVDWLLVFDNVHSDALDFLRSHLPRSNARGHILFSTRTAEVAAELVNAAGQQHPILRLQTLSPRESVDLLVGDSGVDLEMVTPSLLKQAEELVACVGRLPLAVVHAALFMKQTGTTLGEMLKLYKTERKMEAIQWENNLTPYEARSVAVTFTNQIDQLNQESPDLRNLLKVLSFIDPENIPVGMIIEGAQELLHLQKEPQQVPLRPKFSLVQRLKKWGQKRGSKDDRARIQSHNISSTSRISLESQSLISLILSPFELQKAIQKLTNLSLVERRSNSGDSSLWMHDLIQFMIRESTRTEETRQEWLQLSVSLVYSAFQHIESPELPQSWTECEKFIPHLRSLNQAWNDAYGINVELTEAMSTIALYLESRGRYEEAEDVCYQALEVRKKHLGTDHSDTLLLMNNLAEVYRSQGRYDEAEVVLKNVLAIGKKNLGQKRVVVMNNLALVYMSQGRYDESELLLKCVLASWEKDLGADHPDTLLSMNNLAEVYRLQSRYDEAEMLLKRALAIWEKHPGVDHPNKLLSMNNLALVYSSQGRYDVSEVLFKHVSTSWEKDLGADHPNTLLSMNNLAEVYRLQRRYDEAEMLLKRALAIWEKHSGVDHPNKLLSVNNLALVYLSQGRYDESEVLLKHVSARSEKDLGADHPNTLLSMNNLAEVYRLQGRYDESEVLYRRAIASADHPTMLVFMENLAGMYRSQGKYNEAEALLKRVLASQEKALGSGHPEIKETADRLASLYQLQGPGEASREEVAVIV